MATLPSWPTVVHEINTRAPNDPAGVDNWLLVTPYVTKFSIQRGKSDELTAIGPGTMSWELRGTAGEWDPDNAASPFYPYLTAWRQVRTSARWPVTANLLSANAASIETDASDWVLSAGTAIARSTAQALSGSASLAMTNSGGSGTAVALASRVGVTALASYTALASFRAATTGRSCRVDIGWYNAAGVNIGNVSSASVSDTTVGWVQAAITATAPATTTTALVTLVAPTSAGAAGEVHYADEMGLFAGTVSTWVAGYNNFPLFTGYNTDGWTTAFASRGKREYGKAQFSDALAVLERVGLLDVTLAEILADGPLAVYPLDESGGMQAGNRSAFKQDNATLPGSAAITSTLGGTSPIPLATATGLVVSRTGTANLATPAVLSLPSGAIPTVSAGATWEVWLKVSDPTAMATTASLLYNANGSGNGVRLIQNAGVIFGDFTTAAGHRFTASYTLPTDGSAVHVALVLNAAATQLSLYINGALFDTTTALGTPLAQADVPTLQAFWPGSSAALTISYANFATYSSPLPAARLLAHYRAGYDAFYGDTPAVRIARLLSYPAWLTTLQNLDTTSVGELNTPLQGATGLDGSSVTAELLHIADSTMSDVDVDGSGKVRYRSRDYRLLQTTPSVVFGPTTASGEIPYSDPAPEIGGNPKFTYPQIQVQQRNGITALGSDATAVKNNFEQMLTKSDVILADPSMVLDLRDDLLRRYKDKHNRATPITINAAAYPAGWPSVLGLDTAQRCRVNTAPQGAPAKSVESYVEAFSHDVDPTSATPWVVTVTTSAAPPFFPWVLGDATYSVLGSTTVPCF